SRTRYSPVLRSTISTRAAALIEWTSRSPIFCLSVAGDVGEISRLVRSESRNRYMPSDLPGPAGRASCPVRHGWRQAPPRSDTVERGLLGVDRSVKHDLVLTRRRVGRLHPHPGRGRADEHLAQLAAKPRRRRRSRFEEREILEAKTVH